MLVRTLAKVLRLERCEPPMLVFSGEWLSHSYYWMRIAAKAKRQVRCWISNAMPVTGPRHSPSTISYPNSGPRIAQTSSGRPGYSFRPRNILASGREYSNPRACTILLMNGFALLQSVSTIPLEDCARNLSRILWPVPSSIAIHGPR
jgi:hypothetical protein